MYVCWNLTISYVSEGWILCYFILDIQTIESFNQNNSGSLATYSSCGMFSLDIIRSHNRYLTTLNIKTKHFHSKILFCLPPTAYMYELNIKSNKYEYSSAHSYNINICTINGKLFITHSKCITSTHHISKAVWSNASPVFCLNWCLKLILTSLQIIDV